jgi:TolB-like protein
MVLLPLICASIGAIAEEDSQIAIYLSRFAVSSDDLYYIADGIQTTILNQLSRFPEITVYEETSGLGDVFQDVESILRMDKVHLLQIRRETGFDGLIAGAIERLEWDLQVTLYLIDFSSGRVYYSGKVEGKFGSELLGQLEDKLRAYANALIHYYSSLLSVTSEPDGATVRVNGREVGITPVDWLDVEDGELRIEIAKEGYIPYVKDIHLDRGQRASVHARLYDPMADYLLSKRRRWTLDSHNFGLARAVQYQSLPEIDLKAERITNLRYLAKFRRWNLGMESVWGSWEATQRFDTFLGPDTGKSSFTVDFKRFGFLVQYNLFERLNQFDLYLGAQIGFASVVSHQPRAEEMLGKLSEVNPALGGEIGMRFYFKRFLKLSAFAGGCYAGKLRYARKQATYWGEPWYERRSLSLNPAYAGMMLSCSFWPALR